MAKITIQDQLITQKGTINFLLQKVGRKLGNEEMWKLQKDIISLLQAYDEQ